MNKSLGVSIKYRDQSEVQIAHFQHKVVGVQQQVITQHTILFRKWHMPREDLRNNVAEQRTSLLRICLKHLK